MKLVELHVCHPATGPPSHGDAIPGRAVRVGGVEVDFARAAGGQHRHAGAEALDAGLARVEEVSEGGSVPELRFTNSAAMPILIVDGEELVGAKQNRVANLTILAPAKTTIRIPVSCVEAGRWRYSRDSLPAGMTWLIS